MPLKYRRHEEKGIDETPPEAEPSSIKRQVLSTALIFGGAILIALFAKAYIVQPYVVEGESMETTLQNGDRLLVNKIPHTFARLTGDDYLPKRSDIIVFNQSGLANLSTNKQLIKRVIALPGERIVVRNGTLTVYNDAHPGGFNPDTTGGYKISAASTAGNVDLVLANDEVFVCGDNRNNSEDSRYFGPIRSDKIVGKLTLRLWPLSKADRF